MTHKELRLIRKLMGIFMPYLARQLDRVRRDSRRMVHYTSAENLFKILSSRTIWMRNANCMVDYREVQHGSEMLADFFNETTHRSDFCIALNACHPNIGEESLRLFDQWWGNIRVNTYICS